MFSSGPGTYPASLSISDDYNGKIDEKSFKIVIAQNPLFVPWAPGAELSQSLIMLPPVETDAEYSMSLRTYPFQLPCALDPSSQLPPGLTISQADCRITGKIPSAGLTADRWVFTVNTLVVTLPSSSYAYPNVTYSSIQKTFSLSVIPKGARPSVTQSSTGASLSLPPQ